MLWDTRNSKAPVHNFRAEKGVLYACQFSPMNKNVFATGGEEKVIKVWDVRNMSEPIVQMSDMHDQEITQLKWSSHER